MSILEEFKGPSGEIYFSSQEYEFPHFPSESTDFIPPQLDTVLVVPNKVYHEGYHGVIDVCFFNKWTLQLVIDFTKSGSIERISGRFPKPITFLGVFGLVGSENNTGPDMTYKDNSLTMTCGITFLDKQEITGQFSVVHRHDFHGIEASLSLDFLPTWSSNKQFSVAWSRENQWQFKIPILGSVPRSVFDFAAIIKKVLLWLFKLAVGGITFGVKFWATVGENIDPKKYFVTFRIHGYFYVEFLGLLKLPAIALPEEGIPLVIEGVNYREVRLSDIPKLIISNLTTNAKLLVKYLWECITKGNLLEHLAYTVKLAVGSVCSTIKEVYSIAKDGLLCIKNVFSTRSGSVKILYKERVIGEILGGKKCQQFKNEKKITGMFGELAMLLGIAKISKALYRGGKAHLAIPKEVRPTQVDGKHDYEQNVKQLDLTSNDLATTVAHIIEDELCITDIEVQINCTCVSIKWSLKNEVLLCDDGDIEYEILLYVTSLNEFSSELLTFPVIGPKPVSYKLNAGGTNTLTKLDDQYFLSIPPKTSHPILYASVSIRASVTMTVRSLMEKLKYNRRVSVTLLGSWHHIQQQVGNEVLLPSEVEETCFIKSLAYDSGEMIVAPTVDESLLSNESINFVQVVDQKNTSVVLARITLHTTCSPKLSLNELPPDSEGPYQLQVVSVTSAENQVALHSSDEVIHRNPHPRNIQTILPDQLQQGADASTKWKVGRSELDSYSSHRCPHCVSSIVTVESAETFTCLYTLCCKQTLEMDGKTAEVNHILVTEEVKANQYNEFKIHFNPQNAVKHHKCAEKCEGIMLDETKALTLQPCVITKSNKHFLQSKAAKGPALHVFGPPKAINLFCPSKRDDIEVWLKYADQSLSYQVEVIDGEGSIVYGPIVYHHKEFIKFEKSQAGYDRNPANSQDFQEECDSKAQEAWDSKHCLKIHKLCCCLKENVEYKLQVFSDGYGDQYFMSIVPLIAPETIQLLPVKLEYDPESDEVRVDFETSRYKASSYTVELFLFTESGEDCLVSMNIGSSPCIIPLHQYQTIPNGTIRALVKATNNHATSTTQQTHSYLIGISAEEFSVMPDPYCAYSFSFVSTYPNYLLEKADLEWREQDDIPGYFFGIINYDSNEVIYKEKTSKGQGLVRFFAYTLRLILPQLANAPVQFACFLQSIATPRRVNSNPQKSLPLQCLESKCLENQDFIIFFSFHLNNLRNLYAEIQTLRCFIPTNALPKFLLVVLPTTSAVTLPDLSDACKPKLVNLCHKDSIGFLYVHMNSILSEPLRLKKGLVFTKAKHYSEVFKSFPNGQKIVGWIYARCRASIGTTITMTVEHKRKKKWSERKLFASTWLTKKKKKVSATFTKYGEVKELLDCSVLNISGNDQVSISLELSRSSSCQILNLLVTGRVVRW